MNMTFNFSNATQYGNNFGVTAVTQNGYTTGQLTGISIDYTGVVQAQYTNGHSVNLGPGRDGELRQPAGPAAARQQQLGADQCLRRRPVHGVAGGSGFGTISSGSLEESNVDITTQLVDMITAQRAFQANAQMIQTEDQITQTIIGIRQ